MEGYHCHRGPLAGQSFTSRAEALKALEHQQKKPDRLAEPDRSAEPDREERTVYVTKTGKKYHGPYCRYLSKSRIPIPLKEARAQGYTPCSRCRGR